tara:strand:- start:344494 stop:346251 length:1758 start_codon:yes stop_codon:yes gene_type:complete
MAVVIRGQEVSLPVDLRQHNLVEYNSSLFNPTFSLDYNYPQSIALWMRWQWQSVDVDPTTLFLNYSTKLNDVSSVGAAFFQHNTGLFFNTGGVVNYARTFNLSPTLKLAVGANVFGFKQELADERFQADPQLPFPDLAPSNDFILQLAPGVRLSGGNFSFSLASENLFDYNFKDKGQNTSLSDKIFLGMASYDFPIGMKKDSTAFLRPRIYLRTIPGMSNQIGMGTLFSTSKYWTQVGYNNFYGVSFGAGSTFFKRASLGVLVEFGTSSTMRDQDPSFEIVMGYFFGKPEERRKKFGVEEIEENPLEETDENEKIKEELKKAQNLANEKKDVERAEEKLRKKEAKELAALEKKMRKDSLALVKKDTEALAVEQKEAKKQAKIAAEKAEEVARETAKKEALALAEKEASEREAEQKRLAAEAEKAEAIKVAQLEQQRLDSIAREQEKEALAEAQRAAQIKQDSIDSAAREAIEEARRKQTEVAKAQNEVDRPKAGEKYEEVKTEDGLLPGYYLITNVFGTKKYFEAFMADLERKGLQPKSFLRSKNKFHYVYLERYQTMSEARKARDSKFNGRYQEKTWIFRVKEE